MNFIKTLIILQLLCLFVSSCSTSEGKSLGGLMDGKSGLHYVTNSFKAKKENILFIHGTPGSKDAFKDYILDEELGSKYNMVSIDRLGFGSSYSKKAVTTFSSHSKAILLFLKSKFKGKRFHCVAHSYGSPLCLYLMSQSPSQFKDAVLVSGAFNHERKILKWYNKLANNFFIKKALSLPLRNSNQEMEGLKQELINLESNLSKIKGKVHLIHGKKDKIVPFNDSLWLENKLKKSQKGTFVESEKNGHFILWKNFDLIKKTILKEIN